MLEETPEWLPLQLSCSREPKLGKVCAHTMCTLKPHLYRAHIWTCDCAIQCPSVEEQATSAALRAKTVTQEVTRTILTSYSVLFLS